MRHKLLIVDDEPMIYHALRRGLHREAEWETMYAAGAEAALEILETEAIDIVICDENMPGMNGSQLLGLVRQRWPDVIRMMLTGDARVDVVMKAINNGEIYRFFTKPCNEAELIVALRDALQMKKLKSESRRLLDMVKSQAARIRMLEGKGGPLTDTQDAVPAAPVAVGQRSMSLDEITGRAPSPGAEPAPARGNGVIDLNGGVDDVDSLLDEIRSELDNIAR
ncbi:MAG: response regulator [Planctomycetes bacterium]|nr:response regulator [Planctomycetota bacterium]